MNKIKQRFLNWLKKLLGIYTHQDAMDEMHAEILEDRKKEREEFDASKWLNPSMEPYKKINDINDALYFLNLSMEEWLTLNGWEYHYNHHDLSGIVGLWRKGGVENTGPNILQLEIKNNNIKYIHAKTNTEDS